MSYRNDQDALFARLTATERENAALREQLRRAVQPAKPVKSTTLESGTTLEPESKVWAVLTVVGHVFWLSLIAGPVLLGFLLG